MCYIPLKFLVSQKDDLDVFVHDLGVWHCSALGVSTLAPAKLFKLIKHKAFPYKYLACK